MENLRQIVNRAKEALKFEDEKLFDEDFGLVMKGFFYTAVYRSEKIKRNFWISFFVPLTVILGAIKDTLYWFYMGEIVEFLINAVFLICMATCYAEVRNFWEKQETIVELVKDIQKLHPREYDLKIDRNYRKTATRVIKAFMACTFGFELVACVLLCFGITFSTLMYPMILDVVAKGKLYGLLAILNVPHLVLGTICSASGEFLHILCVFRLEANLKILAEKLKNAVNESDLISCVEYHLKIMDCKNRIKDIFNPIFMMKVYTLYFQVSVALMIFTNVSCKKKFLRKVLNKFF